MKKKIWSRFIKAFLAFIIVFSGLMPALTNETQAVQTEWNPLNDWNPQNGQSFDPVAEVLQAATSGQNHTAGKGVSPVTDVNNPQTVKPPEPVNPATGALVLSEKDFSYTLYGSELEIFRFYMSEKPGNLSS